MELIIEILAWASLTHLIVQFFEDNNILQFKPFNCEKCLGFWLSVGPNFAFYGAKGILLSALIGVTADQIYKLTNRL